MAQIHLDSNQTPVRATYAQHTGGERCDWIHVQRTATNRPIDYIAWGSHASYFSSGYHFNGGASDTSGGDGYTAIAQVDDITAPPAWIGWPGKFGGSDRSPVGPGWQPDDKYDDPVAWSAGVDSCTESQTQPFRIARDGEKGNGISRELVAPLPPPLPKKVVARRAGRKVTTTYCFTTLQVKPPSRKPWQIITSVDAAGYKYPPLTRISLIKTRCGRVTQALGLGSPPFRVNVAVLARNGRRSKTISIPLSLEERRIS